MNCQDILDRLQKVRGNGNGYTALCPAHNDRNPSLSVQECDGRILLKCHAGCSVEDIVRAIGCTMKDLFSRQTERNGQSMPVQSISATEIEQMHQRLGQVERDHLSEKRLISEAVVNRYRLGAVEKSGMWRITIPIADKTGVIRDVRCWLPPERRTERASKMTHWAKGYGAPRLFPINQLDYDDLVLVEGELDALALISQGIHAITITAGATTWPEELSSHFVGKRVTVCMDNDEAGQNGAEQRAESLVKYASTVRISTWPEERCKGWDVTDELKEHGLESIPALLAAAETYAAEDDEVAHNGDQILSFPIQALAGPLQRLCAEGAAAIQCPADYLAVPLLVLAGAAIGRSRCLKLKEGWEEYSSLYAAIVADPGSAKSPAMKQAAAPMLKRAQELHESHRIHLAQYEQDERRWKKNPDQCSKPEKPTPKRVFVSDITVESLAQVMDENPRGLALYRDELSGWAQAMNAYKGGKGGDRQFFLSLWSGTPSPVDRKSQDSPLFLSHPFLAIVGTIQPDTLQALLHDSRWDDGLMDRILYAYPNAVIPEAWSDAEIAAETQQEIDALFECLYELEADDGHTTVVMDGAAHALWIEWYSCNQQQLKEGPDYLRGVWSKMPSQCSRLILISHLTRWAAGEVGDPYLVDDHSVVSGTLLAEYFKSHSRRIHGVIGENDEERRRRKVAAWIMRKGNDGVTARLIQRAKVDGIKKAEEAHKVLDQLVSMGQGYWKTPKRRISGQRSAKGFYLHDGSTPDIFSHLVVGQKEG